MLFAHLSDLHLHVHFGAVEILAGLLLIGIPFINKFLGEYYPWNYFNVHTPARPAGRGKDQLGRWGHYKQPTGQMQKQITVWSD